MVRRLGRAGLLGYFGTGGVRLDQVDQAIRDIQHTLGVTVRTG